MKTVRNITEIKPFLPKIRKIIKSIYGNRLVDIILYGSFARNKASQESDIDILTILKGDVNRIIEINKIQNELYKIELETGELISVYPVSEEEYNTSVWPLYYYARKEGIKI